MAKAEKLYKNYFLEYASYVIKDRAIPELMDGFKPVQRRIIHAMLEKDDGRFNKVAGIVGDTMHYHPHGDTSIYGALVTLENAGLFIEGQGNYGNFLTGDTAAAARYIEARLKPFAKKVLYSPEITEYEDSYDGRHKEPIVFPAKIPVVAIQGASGIAVGMATKILPHNLIEVLEAQKKALRGEKVEVYPDFPGGGFVDVSEYDDGKGRVTVRAKLNASDPKKLVIEELPFEVTSSAMIESIEKANKNGRLKIASINDYTAEKANIEICWQRGTYSEDMVDVLYATTDCQLKISVNPLVIDDGLPRIVGISEMIDYHAKHLVHVLTQELNCDLVHLNERKRARTMERIFIEERIYKKIENKTTQEQINKAIISGFKPFVDSELGGVDVTKDDLERLLKIPIRRISLFDIEKNRQELAAIEADIADRNYKLEHIIDYATDYLTELESMVDPEEFKRKTKISSIEIVTAKDVAVRNMDLRYDKETGYMGTSLKTGDPLLKVSPFDKVFYMKSNGEYRVINAEEKTFVGKEGIFYINYAEKDIISKEVFTVIYRDKLGEKNVYMIKRFRVSAWSNDKSYFAVTGNNAKVKKISLYPSAKIMLKYKTGLGYRVLEEEFRFADFRILKTATGAGQQLATKELSSIAIRPIKETMTSEEAAPDLFGDRK